MLAPHGGDLPGELKELAVASAAMYRIRARMEDEAATRPHDRMWRASIFAADGAILIGAEAQHVEGARSLSSSE